MAAKERSDSGRPEAPQAYFGNLEAMAKAWEPAVRGASRWNVELMGLAARRSRAWLEVPARAANCKTPQDLVREQMQFWQSAVQDYAGAAQRLAVAFGSMPSIFNGAWSEGAAAHQRDFIDIQPARTEPDAEARPRSDRRAA